MRKLLWKPGPSIARYILVLLAVVGCKANYRGEFAGSTPLRVRNLTQHPVQSLWLVPETRHNDSDNWLSYPIQPGGEVTFTLKNGGYWFNAKGPNGIDTGTSVNSKFGKLIMLQGPTELVLYDRSTPAHETTNNASRVTFPFDTAQPAAPAAAPAPAPAAAPAPAPAEPAPAPAAPAPTTP